MIDIVKELRKHFQIGPAGADEDVIRIVMRHEFEPHGRASETWETVWYLHLPKVQYMWQSTTGWQKGKRGLHQKFKGKTLREVLEKAGNYLTTADWRPIE